MGVLKSHYEILGVPVDATADEIKSAYFDIARRLHPDVNPSPGAHDQFLEIQNAYDVLADAARKKLYDQEFFGGKKPNINLSSHIRYSRSSLIKLDEPQLIYVLIDVVSTAEPDLDSIPPAHLCLVIDRSTSMQGSRMEMVRANIAHLLGHLRKKDLISIVLFSDRAEVMVPPTEMSDIGRVEMQLRQIQTGGATEIYQGLEAGISLLRTGSGINTTKMLVLLTDGHTYGDEEPCLRLAEEVAAENISINTMGIGHEWNDTFLDRLSSLSGGSSIFVTGTKDLYNYLDQKIRSMGYIYGRGVRLEYELDPNVELNYAFRLKPEISPLVFGSPMQLGDLYHNQPVSLLMEFLVKPITTDVESMELLKGRLLMEIPSIRPPLGRIHVRLRRPIRADMTRELPPSAIVDALAKLTLYRMQEKARKEVEAGEISKATRHLQYLATHLLAQGNRELAHSVLIEAENIQQSRNYSKDGDKRIKYGTRALLSLPAPEQDRI